MGDRGSAHPRREWRVQPGKRLHQPKPLVTALDGAGPAPNAVASEPEVRLAGRLLSVSIPSWSCGPARGLRDSL
jgi:hypothetical protein